MENISKNLRGFRFLIAISLISIIGVFSMQAIPQDLAYHVFSDTQSLFGISNVYNVLSNLPFLIIGLMGLYSVFSKQIQCVDEFRVAYIILFSGVTLVSVGSGYYHLAPDNHTLVWDRLPMTIAFMSLFAIIVSEFISLRLAKILLYPFIIMGIASVYYWQLTESAGQGDLRLYVLVQFLPILLIPIIFYNFKSRYTDIKGYWWLLAAYAAAKLLEHFDAQIHLFTGFISGHSLKHIAAATGMYMLIIYYRKRQHS